MADALHTGEAGASATDDRVPPSDGCAAAGLLYSIPVRQGWRYMCSHGSYAAALHTGEAGVGAVGDRVASSDVCAAHGCRTPNFATRVVLRYETHLAVSAVEVAADQPHSIPARQGRALRVRSWQQASHTPNQSMLTD